MNEEMDHKLGTKSKIQYDTLHTDLQMIVDWVLKYCVVDMTLVEGHRPVEKQFEYFKKGRQQDRGGKYTIIANRRDVITNIDGYDKKGKHNYTPSLAVDFRAYVPNKSQLSWDAIHLTYIGASMLLAAEFLFLQGVITHKLRWGGNWDKDGDLSDNTLYDRPHVELYKP